MHTPTDDSMTRTVADLDEVWVPELGRSLAKSTVVAFSRAKEPARLAAARIETYLKAGIGRHRPVSAAQLTTMAEGRYFSEPACESTAVELAAARACIADLRQLLNT